MHSLIWFSIGLSTLFAIAPLFGKPSFRTTLVIFIFGSIAFLQTYLLLFVTQTLHRYPLFFMGYVPIMVLLSVSLYLYFLLRLEDREWTLDDVSHGIPIVISFSAYLVLFKWPIESKIHAISQLYLGQKSPVLLVFTRLSTLISVSYLARTLLLDSGYHSFNVRRRPGVTGIALLAGIALVSMLSLGIVSTPINLYILRFISPVFACIFICASAIHLRHPHHFSGWISEAKKTYQKRHYLNEINVSHTRDTLISLMTQDHHYRDSELTLPKLADLLGVSKYQLSQLLNQDMQTTFVKFLQHYRVEAAKKLLKTQPNRTILSIAFEVGFNSNSSFQTGFKTCTGMTPSEYRQKG